MSKAIEVMKQKISEGPVPIGAVDKNGVELHQFDAICIEDKLLQILWSATFEDYAANDGEGLFCTREVFSKAEKIGSQKDWTEYDDIDGDHIIQLLKISDPKHIVWQRTEEYEELITNFWVFKDKKFGLLLTHKLKELFGKRISIGESIRRQGFYDFINDEKEITITKPEKFITNPIQTSESDQIGKMTGIAFGGCKVIKFESFISGIDEDWANVLPYEDCQKCYCSGPKKPIHFGEEKKLSILPRARWESDFSKAISDMNDFLKEINQCQQQEMKQEKKQ